MKQNSLQQLLAKYQEGTLSSEELEQLNALTHRDEVMAEAEGRARGIIRRRTRIAGMAVATAVVMGAGIWLLSPRTEEPVLVASNVEKPVPIEVRETVVNEEVEALKEEAVAPGKTDRNVVVAQKVKTEEPGSVIAAAPVDSTFNVQQSSVPEPVVVCNSHCDADSVINDIWKFLSA